MTDAFDKAYFEQNNYASYLERQERYVRMAREIEFDLFRKLKLDFSHKPVLDFGCAVGFITRAFKDIGYTNIVGYDVSKWAIEYGHKNLGLTDNDTTCEIFHIRMQQDWNLIMAFDVLEHLDFKSLLSFLHFWKDTYLLIRVPLTHKTDGPYVLQVSENDPTHVLRYTRQDWHTLLMDLGGFAWLFDVNLGTMYDTDGVMCAMFRSGCPR